MLRWGGLYVLLLMSVSFFSYAFTDPNLVLSTHEQYWSFQQFMWQLGEQRDLLSVGYGVVIAGLFIAYYRILKTMEEREHNSASLRVLTQDWLLPIRRWWATHQKARQYILVGVPIVVLLFGYNALSHDVFNYLFNSKMILEYGANPHTQVALDFAHDPWVRFMHNTHTPAPYGRGWTLLSLLPASLGMGIFSVSWLLFRLFSVLSLFLFLAVGQYWYELRSTKLKDWQVVALFWNPLILIEIVLNMHNDFWMLLPAALSLALLYKQHTARVLLTSAVLLATSIAVKLATVALVPLWLFLAFSHRIADVTFPREYQKLIAGFVSRVVYQRLWDRVPLIASVLLFLPLLTERSKFYLPWYLSWSMCWILFSKHQSSAWWSFLQVASFAAMLRYIPWILEGGFSQLVQTQQLLIVWAVPLIYMVYVLFFRPKPKTSLQQRWFS